MMTEDNRLIYARAKDKLEATKEFEAAVSEGRAAALQEKVSGDSKRFGCTNRKGADLLVDHSLQDFSGVSPSTGEN